jgi:hypothetical protein
MHGRPLEMAEMVAEVDATTSDDIARVASQIVASAPTIAAIGPSGTLPGAFDFMARRADLEPVG